MTLFFIYHRPYHFLAKPVTIDDFDDEISRIKPIRLGGNATLICPFINIKHFKWIKNGEFLISDAGLELTLVNVTPDIGGNIILYQFSIQFVTL